MVALPKESPLDLDYRLALHLLLPFNLLPVLVQVLLSHFQVLNLFNLHPVLVQELSHLDQQVDPKMM